MSMKVADEPVLSAVNFSAIRQRCPGCQRALPIRPPQNDETFAEWQCEACHTRLAGIFVPEIVPTLADRVRLCPQHFDASRAEPIPPELRKLVAKFLAGRESRLATHERRRNPRVPCDLDAVIVGLDDRWTPHGQPMRAVVIDLAEHGLGMMTAQRVDAARLAIQIQCSAGLVQLFGRTAWSNFVSDGFQNTGVEFRHRLGRTTLKVEEQ